MENSQAHGKKIKKLRSIFLASVLFFVAGASVIMVALFNNQNKVEEQARVDLQEMQSDHLAIYNEIEQNLAEITAHENLVRLNFNSPEQMGPLTPRERIDQEISIIGELLQQNNALITDLEGRLSENDTQLAAYLDKNKNLERKLSKFSKEIDELEKRNAALVAERDELKKYNSNLVNDLSLSQNEIAELGTSLVGNAMLLQAKNTEIANLNTEINTTYYVVGNYKELKELDVVEKEGSIVGIGGSKTIKDDFDKDQFVAIDKMNYTIIPVFSKKVELATTHPTSSYRWVEGEDQIKYLEILNPTAFWENSSYLVVLTAKEMNFLKAA